MASKGNQNSSGGGGRRTTTNQPRKGGPVRRIVQPAPQGYKVVAPHHRRASAVEPTKKAATQRAKEIVGTWAVAKSPTGMVKGVSLTRTPSAKAMTRIHRGTKSTDRANLF